jgi:DNA-binding CsgD family transcriptional regulator
LARNEIRELLERLVERSLVSIHIGVEAVRYSLLESLRLFAGERLAERSDEPTRLAQRHRYHHRDKILQARAHRFGPAEQQLLTWASGAWSDIQRAIDTSLHTPGDAAVGLQIAVGMLSQRGAPLVGSLPEIRGRIERMVAATEESQPWSVELRVDAMARTVWMALLQGCPEDAKELLERCVAACDANAARTGHWRHRPEIDIGLPAVVDFAWGGELMLACRDPRAIAVLARARDKFRGRHDRCGEAMSELFEAMAAGFLGSADQAMNIAQRHLERTTSAGAAWAQSWAQLMLAIALTRRGDAEEALQVGRAALAYQVALGDLWSATWAVHIRRWALARLITDQMDSRSNRRNDLVRLTTESAYLAGGLKTQLARLGAKVENLDLLADEISAAERIARDVLGQDTYAELEKRGARLFSERSEIERLAQGTLSISASVSTATSNANWRSLTDAEREVALLAAAGWPNSAIGVRRGTTTKTTDAQMSSILQKLMIESRADIAGLVPQDQRDRVSAERCNIPRQSRDKPRSIPTRPPG